MRDVDPLLHLDVDGRSIELVLPSIKGVHGLVIELNARSAATLGGSLPIFLLELVASVDGSPLDLRAADTLAADAQLVRAVMSRVAHLLDERRTKGTIYLLCPGCFNSETEVPVDAFALALAAPIPSVFDGPYLAIPWLAGALGYGLRPVGLRCEAGVRVSLPSARAGSPFTVSHGGLVHVEDEPSDDVQRPEIFDESFDFTHCGPGYRALLRLARALQPSHDVSVLEQMPAVDFFFLDLAYYLTHLAPIRADTPGRLRCKRCATEFLPVV